MNDTITYFTIGYKLKTKDPYNVGQLKNLFVDQESFIANIVAENKDAAVEQLKNDYNMATVEVDSISEPLYMTREEYENG